MKQLLFIFCLIVAFIACNDDDDNNKDNPTEELPIKNLVMPSATTPFTTGQTVTIQGKGFTDNSEIWLRNITKAEDDIPTTITNVDDSSISFTVPEKVSGEKQVILKQDGKQYPLGKLNFESVEKTEENLYGCSVEREENEKTIVHIIKIDLSSLTTKEIAKIDFSEYSYVGDVYGIIGLPSTKEIICSIGDKFIKVNQETGQYTVLLNIEAGVDLVIDKNENIYSYRYDNTESNIIHKILITDKNTGKSKTFTTLDLEDNDEIYDLVCLPQSNELIGIVKAGLIKIDLTTKKITIIPIENNTANLCVDKDENLYNLSQGYEGETSFYYLEKIDKNTGKKQTLISNLGVKHAPETYTYFRPSNEIISIEDSKTLTRINLDNYTSTNISLQHNMSGIGAN